MKGCFMVICFIASVVAVPVQPTSNQTHRSSHNPLTSQAPPTLLPPTLRPSTLRSIRTATAVPVVVPSSNHSRHLLIQISPLSIPVSSSKTVTAKTTSTAPKNASLRSAPTPAENKVEAFAKKLRADIEASERVLNVFIKTINDKHINAQNNLKRANENLSNIKKLIVKYKNEIVNATKYEDKYQVDQTAQSKQSSVLSSEYQKAKKMYLEEQANIKFEKQFLEEIIKYIQLRKTQKC